MQDDVFGRLAGVGLKPNTHPAVAFLALFEPLCSHRVGKREKSRSVGPVILDARDQQVEFAFEHPLEPRAGYITPVRGFAVNLVAELHVVGRHGLGDCAGGGACLEEPAGDFLPGADFHDGSVFQRVEIDRECFFDRAGDVVGHLQFHLRCSVGPRDSGCDVTCSLIWAQRRVVTDFLSRRGCDGLPIRPPDELPAELSAG